MEEEEEETVVKYFLNSFTQIKIKNPKFTKAKEETKY